MLTFWKGYLFRRKSCLLINANVHKDNKQVLTAHLVKSLFHSLGASEVSPTNLTPVESFCSANASLANPQAITTKSLWQLFQSSALQYMARIWFTDVEDHVHQNFNLSNHSHSQIKTWFSSRINSFFTSKTRLQCATATLQCIDVIWNIRIFWQSSPQGDL